MSTIAITQAKNNHIVPVGLIIFLVLAGACTVYMRVVAPEKKPEKLNHSLIQLPDASFIILIILIQIFYPQMHQKVYHRTAIMIKYYFLYIEFYKDRSSNLLTSFYIPDLRYLQHMVLF